MGRKGGQGQGGRRLVFQDVLDYGFGQFSFAYFHQQGVGPPNLVSQKAVGFTFDYKLIPFPEQHPFFHPADGALVQGMAGSQGPEIVDADKVAGGPAHGVVVQGFPYQVAGVPAQRGRRPAVEDAVTVGAAGGVPAGVEILGHPVSGLYLYISRQEMVQRPVEYLQGIRGNGQEVHHLPLGVRPGIGAAGGAHSGPVSGEVGYGFFDCSLYGRLVLLVLKAGVVGAVVFYNQGQAAGGGKFRAVGRRAGGV